MAYDEEIKRILSDGEWHSTKEVTRKITEMRKKFANWHLVYRELEKLNHQGKVVRIERPRIILWKLKDRVKL